MDEVFDGAMKERLKQDVISQVSHLCLYIDRVLIRVDSYAMVRSCYLARTIANKGKVDFDLLPVAHRPSLFYLLLSIQSLSSDIVLEVARCTLLEQDVSLSFWQRSRTRQKR